MNMQKIDTELNQKSESKLKPSTAKHGLKSLLDDKCLEKSDMEENPCIEKISKNKKMISNLNDDPDLESSVLAQVSAQYENKELENLIKEKQENLEKLKANLNRISSKVVPTTEAEAFDVITNKNQSEATKNCVKCLKGMGEGQSAMDCNHLCGFGGK